MLVDIDVTKNSQRCFSKSIKNLAVHWDGKLSVDQFGAEYDALSIISSGKPNHTNNKVLGSFPLRASLQRAQDEASYEMVGMEEQN